MQTSWDVIIVGARCAGATLATLLAGRGLRTLLLEAGEGGTGMPLSTHFVQPPGMAVLDEIGVGSKVRAVAPATRTFRLALDDAAVHASMPPERPGRCIRRSVIDPWLQEAAVESGAAFLDRHRVVELLWEGQRVSGVVARTPTGTVSFRADCVVGADGPASTVAKRTGVEEYLVTEGSRVGYWSYYPAPAVWDRPWDATLEHRGDELRYVFRCDADQLALVYVGERNAVTAWGQDYRAKLVDALARSETTQQLVENKQPIGKVVGLLKTRFFYRRPVGPGFALVGDAGHFKDFVTGHGMADAFLDARRLADAIVDGRPEAFEHFWRERDVTTLPLHFDAIRQGEVGHNTPFQRWVIAQIGSNPKLRDRLTSVFRRELSPAELVNFPTLLGFVGAALVRARLNVVPGFLATGRRMASETRELAERERLLEAARHALEATAPRAISRRTPMAPAA